MSWFGDLFSRGRNRREGPSGSPEEPAVPGRHAERDTPLSAEEAGSSGEFEDAFMDIQSDMVSVCLEAIRDYGTADVGGERLTGRRLDEALEDVYVYGALWGRFASTFDAFARISGEIKTLNELVESDGFESIFFQACKVGLEDLARIKELCGKWSRPCPAQIRGRYHVGGGYRAHYSYEPLLPEDDAELEAGLEDGSVSLPGDLFREWLDDVRAGNDDLA